jgi:hypothetical protein
MLQAPVMLTTRGRFKCLRIAIFHGESLTGTCFLLPTIDCAAHCCTKSK